MATTVDKIKSIEEEMSKTQKNKATSFHLGLLKAKLAKLKRELLTPQGSGGGGGVGFDVARTGVASVGFIGFPSVGKSTLMSRITGQHSEAAAYEFTTLTTVPGQVVYNGAQPGEHVATSLLGRAHSPDTASTIFHERVKQRPLHLRPSSPDPAQDARSKRQRARLQTAKARRKSKKPKPLSAKQKRALCIYEIPKEQQKYVIYEPLHRMWCAYMREILGLSDGKRHYVDAVNAGPILVSADYHGALVEVVRSRCSSRVGGKGIVVKDTKFTFEIVTAKDELKTMPKEHTVFQFEVLFELQEGDGEVPKPLVFEIHGSQFENRAPDRANKKFRQHFDPDL